MRGTVTCLFRYFYDMHFQTSRLCCCFDILSTYILSGLVFVSTVINLRFFTGLMSGQVRSDRVGSVCWPIKYRNPYSQQSSSSFTLWVGARSTTKRNQRLKIDGQHLFWCGCIQGLAVESLVTFVTKFKLCCWWKAILRHGISAKTPNVGRCGTKILCVLLNSINNRSWMRWYFGQMWKDCSLLAFEHGVVHMKVFFLVFVMLDVHIFPGKIPFYNTTN